MKTLLSRKLQVLTITFGAVFIALFSLGCIANPTLNSASNTNAVLYQTSTIQALAVGLYDGDISFGDVLKHGDFGLGTCQALNGEVIILNGKTYQVRSSGQVFMVPDSALTPFAMVVPFKATRTLHIKKPLDYTQLRQWLLSKLPTPNIIYAIKINGTFTSITTRSVPIQKKPFVPLAAAVKHQKEFTFKNVSGTMVGFRMPGFLKKVNVPGFHFHFLTANRKQGGHVLKVELKNATVQVQSIRSFQLRLPGLKSFDNADFSKNLSADIKKAEEAHQ